MTPRVIKFRIWESWNSIMRPWEDVKKFNISILNRPESVNKTEFIVMQSTGLKDKNGKEIFEGDIVRVLRASWDSKLLCVVEFDRGGWFYNAVNENGSHLGWSFNNNPHLYEVVGNIYENPELLKK